MLLHFIRQFYLIIKSDDRVLMKYKMGNLYYEQYKWKNVMVFIVQKSQFCLCYILLLDSVFGHFVCHPTLSSTTVMDKSTKWLLDWIKSYVHSSLYKGHPSELILVQIPPLLNAFKALVAMVLYSDSLYNKIP